MNAVTGFQTEPLSDKKWQAQFFSQKIDFRKGYYQISVKNEVRHLLVFTASVCYYEFNALPFGLNNAPTIFTLMMRKLIEPLYNPMHN